MMKAFFSLFLALPLFIPCTAQAQKMCTQMWCNEGTSLTLDGGIWPQGSYSFTVQADGKTYECRSSLPFKACEGNTTCDSPDIRIVESGCALPGDTHAFGGFMLSGTPKHIQVHIKHGSGKTFDFKSDIETQCSYPNGRECDPRPCCSATLTAPVMWKDAQ